MNCYHSNRTYPNPLVMAAHMTDDEQNPKLAMARPPLDPTRVGHLANFFCFLLT